MADSGGRSRRRGKKRSQGARSDSGSEGDAEDAAANTGFGLLDGSESESGSGGAGTGEFLNSASSEDAPAGESVEQLWRRRSEVRVKSTMTFGLEEEDRYRPSEPILRGHLLAAESSDSDDDGLHSANTLGNIPLEWYEDYDHEGYNLDGKPIPKGPGDGRGDTISDFIARSDDPNYWRTIYDRLKGKVVLTADEMDLIQRIKRGEFVSDVGAIDPYEDWTDFFDHSKESIHPLRNIVEPKRRFVPSKWEAKKVAKLVRAFREGRIDLKPRPEFDPNAELIAPEDREIEVFDLWEGEDVIRRRGFIAAPKTKLPGHAESYRPPGEFIPTDEEREAWAKLDPEDRPYDFDPTSFDALRKVPGYANFVEERYERCLDLYLATRVQKRRMNVDPAALIPKLPKPRELRPFPTMIGLKFSGHTDKIRSIAPHPSGQWLLSGGDDGTIRLWEVTTGRCQRVWAVGESVRSVAWNPTAHLRPSNSPDGRIALSAFAAAVGNNVLLINPNIGTEAVNAFTDRVLAGPSSPPKASKFAAWEEPTEDEEARGIRVKIVHKWYVSQVTWHGKGDYFATVCPDGESKAVLVHQLSKFGSQAPFSKKKGNVQKVLFHPTKPFFFVATQTKIRIYNLAKQSLIKKLQVGVKWISSMAIHRSGDHVLTGSYDRRVCWMDLDLSSKPYKVLRYHREATRSVAIHPRYPLFASGSDDGTCQVFHGRVYADLLQNVLIVPCKMLRAHRVTDSIGVIDVAWHPHHPYLFSAGADGDIYLYV